MNKLVFKDNEWLKEKQLEEGFLYIIKDGRVMLYLGKSVDDYFIFYNCGSLNFTNAGDYYKYTLSNYDVQVKYMTAMCKELFGKPLYMESVRRLKGLPKIYCKFPFLDFKDGFVKWYAKSAFIHGDLPKLSVVSNEEPNRGFVSTKDLVPGMLYYSGSCWRSTFVYLGRNSDKDFVWCFIGNEDILVRNTGVTLLKNRELDIFTTKSNKKVRPLADALNDKDAYLDSDTKRLIDTNFKLNMVGVTQKMLDNVI